MMIRIFAGMLVTGLLWADVGVVIPAGKVQPNAAEIAIAETKVDILIDHGTATISLRQIFANRTKTALEGQYVFSLPSRSTLSDFAVWDGVVRIPGVVLERREASELYKRVRAQSIDPGLLQAGERTDSDGAQSQTFTANIVPIPAFGTKRLELSYQQRIPVENLESSFSLPFQPSSYQKQTTGKLEINLEVRSDFPLADFAITSKAYSMQIVERNERSVKAKFSGDNVALTEDLAMQWKLNGASANQLSVATHRDTRVDPQGYFEARWLTPASGAAARAPMTLIALFDGSLSNQWEALERSFLTLEASLRASKPEDRFNVIVFHRQQLTWEKVPVPATAEAVDRALAFVKAQSLKPGTNLGAALEAGLAQASTDNSTVLLLSDGQPNLGLVTNPKLLASFVAARNRLASPPKLFVFAASDAANLGLLKLLTRDGGLLEAVRSTEPLEFKLKAFVSKLGRSPMTQVQLQVPSTNSLYALEDSVFPGSLAAWVGRYEKPATVAMAASARTGSATINTSHSVQLPAENLTSAHLPRLWAQARVDALLEKMDRDGEDRMLIEEVIALARKYKLVTPYTSFLAAPRALLRPRLIRPGDPVIRVKTDALISSVTAMFPFGLVKPLRYLDGEATWQTRFLAPADMKDGSYPVTLVMRDKNGRTYREQKTFMILSQAPTPKVSLEQARIRRGEPLTIRADAPPTARRIVARVEGMPPVFLYWSDKAKTNIGTLAIPAQVPAGRYRVEVTAEDMAHNIGRQEVWLEILP